MTPKLAPEVKAQRVIERNRLRERGKTPPVRASRSEPRPRKNSSGEPLSARRNALIGRRLRAMRAARGLSLADIPVFGAGSLGNYEIHNASSMQLGNLIAYAQFLQIDPLEFFTLLLVDDEDDDHVDLDPHRLRVAALIRSLSPQLRVTAVEILQALSKIE